MREDPYVSQQRRSVLLQAIPRMPQTITAAQLSVMLHNAGMHPSRRTIERDLQHLSEHFPLTVDDSGRTFRWSMMKTASIEFMPRLTVSQCLVLTLAQAQVRHLLPQTMLDDVQPVFDAAERELAKTGWKDWHKRTAVVPAGFALLPPKVDAKVLSDVQHALARRVRMTAKYRSKGTRTPRKREIQPLGLLVRGSVQYLVCMLPEYDKPRQLCLHRMSDTVIGTERCKEPHGFSMTHYGRRLTIDSKGKIRLRLIFDAAAADHIRETPLSKYQKWKAIPGTDKVEVNATVDDDLQLKRWLLSFGSEVEVIAPERLRLEMIEELAKARRAYRR